MKSEEEKLDRYTEMIAINMFHEGIDCLIGENLDRSLSEGLILSGCDSPEDFVEKAIMAYIIKSEEAA